MRHVLVVLLLALSSIGAGPRWKTPVDSGCVVPFQTMFVVQNPVLWQTRAAQAWTESDFNPNAKSEVGALGITQFMPATWKEWMGSADPTIPQNSIIAQDKYMKWLEARCSNNLNAALGSYNAGLGNIRRAQFKADQLGISGIDAWMRVYPSVQHSPAFAKQTLDYITRNTTYQNEIKSLIAHQVK